MFKGRKHEVKCRQEKKYGGFFIYNPNKNWYDSRNYFPVNESFALQNKNCESFLEHKTLENKSLDLRRFSFTLTA